MGWGFRNKNLHKGIDSCNTNSASASAVDVVGEEANAKNFNNNEYLAHLYLTSPLVFASLEDL